MAVRHLPYARLTSGFHLHDDVRRSLGSCRTLSYIRSYTLFKRLTRLDSYQKTHGLKRKHFLSMTSIFRLLPWHAGAVMRPCPNAKWPGPFGRHICQWNLDGARAMAARARRDCLRDPRSRRNGHRGSFPVWGRYGRLQQPTGREAGRDCRRGS